ncbi:hypothetical protein ACIBI9_60290 [Nonomuraea sp. NPDC050451]|uniref:hypothetical protein n=1 Tax=Nonomuraea sp. NPDC050451 TaxID=3364364 RepID=UPI0037B6336B
MRAPPAGAHADSVHRTAASSASEAGRSAAAPMPCTTRPAISQPIEGATHRRIRPRADDLSDRFPGLLDPILRISEAESPNSGPP